MGIFDRFSTPKDDSGNNSSKESSTLQKSLDAIHESVPYIDIHLPPEAHDFVDSWSSPQVITLATCSITAFGLGVVVGKKASSSFTFRRIASAHSLQDHQIGPQSVKLRGRVVGVSDGDTFRFYHKPTWFHSSTPDADTKLSDQTIPIRICTIDTPEVAKFGKPSQPFGDEAKALLESQILDRTVSVQILQRDQYGRAVANVSKRTWYGANKYMDELMLKAGLAEVYQGGGAVYGPKGKEHYLRLEETARQSKQGMWSQANRESAAEFKARMKE
jgi:endonuclease YncB( thermonuclease family)